MSILKIKAKLLHSARCWLDKNGYCEVHGPTIIPAAGEWPGYFKVDYFGKKAYLAQGLQPYANSFVASLGKIYTIAPAFRAEKVRTKRHLAEYWRIEVAEKCDLDSVIKTQETLVVHLSNRLASEALEELKCVNRQTNDLVMVQKPFPILTYDEAIDMLQSDGINISWGQRIDWNLENHLSRRFNRPFFIIKFPTSVETMFYESDPERPELTLSVDLLAPEGYGEIGGGGQMVNERKSLLKKMAYEEIEPIDQRWYMNLVQSGGFSHSGFIIGIERLVRWICKLISIEETSAFPRVYNWDYL